MATGDEDRGLYMKYVITKTDTGKPVEGSYFILKPDNDPAARAAMSAYAEATDNQKLRDDLRAWVADLETEGS